MGWKPGIPSGPVNPPSDSGENKSEFTPTPITRMEKFLAGEELKPQNRLEYFLKRASGADAFVIKESTGGYQQLMDLGLSYIDIDNILKSGHNVVLVRHTTSINDKNEHYSIYQLNSLFAIRATSPAKYKAYFVWYDMSNETFEILEYQANLPEDNLILQVPDESQEDPD